MLHSSPPVVLGDCGRPRQDPAIEAYHYHNFRDHPQAEGGLLLGLREEGGAAKQAWRVYRAFESDDEQAVFAVIMLMTLKKFVTKAMRTTAPRRVFVPKTALIKTVGIVTTRSAFPFVATTY